MERLILSRTAPDRPSIISDPEMLHLLIRYGIDMR